MPEWYIFTLLCLSRPESVIETINMKVKVVLTFESVDEILKCDHSNETFTGSYFRMVLFTFKYFTG